MTSRKLILPLLLCLIGMGVAIASQAEDTRQRVQRVLNAKSMVLENNTIVRLACLQAPNVKESTGKMRPGEPMGEESKAMLAALVQGEKVTLSPSPALRDRHSRRIAFAFLKNGQSVQEALLRQGGAIVYPFIDMRDKLSDLFAAERLARAKKRGLWAHPYWQPADAQTVTVPKERYQLVRGTIRQVAQAGGNWYLNFGDNYHTDFTAFIKAADYRQNFAKQNLTQLQGKTLLLRGWVYARDGVMMDITLPEQIELVDG